MTDLKKCPFCGGDVEWEYEPSFDDSFEVDGYGGRVRCCRCHVSMFGHYREETEKMWNERVADL